MSPLHLREQKMKINKKKSTTTFETSSKMGSWGLSSCITKMSSFCSNSQMEEDARRILLEF